ncbi:response regulator transcription factor [Paenibacillus sp. y28]|uniref:response regulator transcription factor n=1 Tax=Paenibacillus sp. y28 TaxID=3129110 RepID=UPI003FA6F966
MARNIHILVVDDEPNIIKFLELGLKNEGFQVSSAQDGLTAINMVQDLHPQLVILDVMMPGMDGFEVCRLIKETENVSVIMLTAKEEVEDRVKGLNLGADDYLVKPFSFQELLARIQARIRNQFPHLVSEVVVGLFRIDDRRKEIHYDERLLTLSATEYELLKYMVVNHGLVLSKTKILDAVWGYDFGGQDNIVEVYVRSIRDKLGDKDHRIIRTIRGAGYRIDA